MGVAYLQVSALWKEISTIPMDKKFNRNRTIWCRNNREILLAKKSSYQDYCSDIPRGRGFVQLNALWAWPEMTSKVNTKGGATHNNSKHLLIASSLVIKLIQNL